MIATRQLLAFGLTHDAIRHRRQKGRLHLVRRGVYAVGRPNVTRYGEWMAAVLVCGDGAVLSHESAAMLWRLRKWQRRGIEVSVSVPLDPRPPEVTVHRRRGLRDEDRTKQACIPVTSPVCTIVDVAARLEDEPLEEMINTADKLDLIDPEALLAALEQFAGRRGVKRVRRLLHPFTLTDSRLERRFIPIARRAGLPKPLTQQWLSGCRVDFYWPDLGLVVETDGLRYHRTASQQATDRVRDQAHTAAGLTCLRFTRAQVWYRPEHVEWTLAQVGARLSRR